MEFVNIAAYRFVQLSEDSLPELKQQLLEKAQQCELKGTILISPEGINLFLAGTPAHCETFKSYLNSFKAFQDLFYKESFSDHQPFTRMLVRIKREIIAFGKSEVQPEEKTAPYLSPETLQQWYQQQRDMIILDTRNDYEVELGTFKQATDLNIESFRAFPDAIAELPQEMKDKPIVTFCTGGIRCEKAAEYMLQQGFKEVYQLEGGILNYFEKCGGDYYDGECFVFDKRVALNAVLKETSTKQCYACREPIPVPQQQQDQLCPHCGQDSMN